MKFWIFLDGRQQGPYDLEQLMDMPVEPTTPVWFEGLPQWLPAGNVAELNPLFGKEAPATDAVEDKAAAQDVKAGETEVLVEEETTVEVVTPVAEEAPAAGKYAPGRRHYNVNNRPDEPCPPTYLGWTIFLTVCCCSPVSLASLVASICVSSYYNSGSLAKSRKASEITAWLIMIAIALGFLPAMLMGLMSGE